MNKAESLDRRAMQLHDDLFAAPGASPDRRGKKPYGHWHRTFRPDSESDRRAFARMVRAAQMLDGGAAMFCFLPAGDDGKRCPLGVDIYTPFGWNMLRGCAEAFASGKTVWLESDAE